MQINATAIIVITIAWVRSITLDVQHYSSGIYLQVYLQYEQQRTRQQNEFICIYMHNIMGIILKPSTIIAV